MSRLRMSRSSIYAKIQRGEFPRPVELGPNSRGWVEAEITEWLCAYLHSLSQLEAARKLATELGVNHG